MDKGITMTADILNLDDFRDFPPGKITVNVFSVPFRQVDGSDARLTYTVTIEPSEFEVLIEHGRTKGGFYLPDVENDAYWFLPWPPAAIQIVRADDQT